MTDDTVLTKPKNKADAIVLGEIHRILDWIDTGSPACVSNVLEMDRDGLIEQFRFKGLEVKVNGTWYKRP